MIWIDYVIIAIIAISALISLMRGFVKEALSLASWILAFFVASTFYEALSKLLSGQIADAVVRDGVAVLILFIATLIVGIVVNAIVAMLVKKSGLSGTDRILGIAFGAVRGALVVSALLFLMVAFTSFPEESWWKESLLVHHFQLIVLWFFEHLEGSFKALG